jgi:hypothetical protein
VIAIAGAGEGEGDRAAVFIGEAGEDVAGCLLGGGAGDGLAADGILTRDRGNKIGEDGVTYRATPVGAETV